MTHLRPSYLALASFAGSLIAGPANADMAAPRPPSVPVPSVSVRPPSINVPIPNVTPHINTQIRDALPRGGRGRDSTSSGRSYDDDRSAKRSGGERRANRSGGDSSDSRAKVGGQAAAAAAAAVDSPSDTKAAAYAAYSGPTDQMMWSADNCDPSGGDYVPPSSKNYVGPKPIATMMPVDLPQTAPTPPPQVATVPEVDGPTTPDAMAPVDTAPPPPPQVATVANVDGPTTSSDTPKKVKPALIDQTWVLSGPNGDSPLVVHKSTVDLDQKQVDDVKDAEQFKYGKDNDPNQQYKPVTSQPSDNQDCAGNAMEHLWGIGKGDDKAKVVVGAPNFYNNVIKPYGAPVDRSNVAPNDVGVFVDQSGGPGHIVTVKSVEPGLFGNKITIISKDGKERVREGVLNDSAWSKSQGNDGIVNQYGGNVNFYRIDTNAIKINQQTAGQ
jgi:hypothetical protein